MTDTGFIVLSINSKLMIKKYGLILLLIIFLFLRVFNLEKGVNFSSEQGLFLSKAKEIYDTKKLTLIGPSTSIKSTISREFYQGPATYYLLLVPIALGGNPIVASYFLIFINLLALIVIYTVIKKKFGFKTAFWASLFFSTYPLLVTYTRFVWNPNFIPLFSAAVLGFLLNINRKRKSLFYLLLGLILGICLQFHYQSFLLILLSFIWLTLRKAKITNFFIVFLGIIAGFFPLLIFELRHNFYNLNTLFLIMQTGSGKQLISFPVYYFLFLAPFICLAIGLLFQKIYKAKKLLAVGILVLYLAWSAYKINGFSTKAPGMSEGWNYKGQKKALEIILKENKKGYNIANLLTGDTRARAMRYLLSLNNSLPGGTGDYPASEWLFVMSKSKEEEVLKNPVWEISSFRPSRIAKAWPIQNGISLYLLEKLKN